MTMLNGVKRWSFMRRPSALFVVPLVLVLLPSGFALADGDGDGVRQPDGFRTHAYRSPVPDALNGARVVSDDEAEALWRSGEAVFIDVFPQAPKPSGLPDGTIWRVPKRESIAGAIWLPNVGYGELQPNLQTFFETTLERLAAGDKAKALVFYCLKDCWMSWNAAKRAVQLGYTNVVWYPDGTDGWREFERPVAALVPLMPPGDANSAKATSSAAD